MKKRSYLKPLALALTAVAITVLTPTSAFAATKSCTVTNVPHDTQTSCKTKYMWFSAFDKLSFLVNLAPGGVDHNNSRTQSTVSGTFTIKRYGSEYLTEEVSFGIDAGLFNSNDLETYFKNTVEATERGKYQVTFTLDRVFGGIDAGYVVKMKKTEFEWPNFPGLPG